jgi:hypothetical protein
VAGDSIRFRLSEKAFALNVLAGTKRIATFGLGKAIFVQACISLCLTRKINVFALKERTLVAKQQQSAGRLASFAAPEGHSGAVFWLKFWRHALLCAPPKPHSGRRKDIGYHNRSFS